MAFKILFEEEQAHLELIIVRIGLQVLPELKMLTPIFNHTSPEEIAWPICMDDWMITTMIFLTSLFFRF